MAIAGGVNPFLRVLRHCHCTCARCCRQLAVTHGNYSEFSPTSSVISFVCLFVCFTPSHLHPTRQKEYISAETGARVSQTDSDLVKTHI